MRLRNALRALRPVEAALEIQVVRLETLVPFGKNRRPFLGKELDFQLLDDRQRYLVLNRKHVRHLAVVAFRPEVVAVAGIDQLRGDPQPITHLLYAALENGVDIEPAPDLADIDILALEGEGGSAGDDEEGVDLGQRIDQFFRQALAEVLVAGIGAEIVERQNGNGWGLPA